jgi:hypothetical protein
LVAAGDAGDPLAASSLAYDGDDGHARGQTFFGERLDDATFNGVRAVEIIDYVGTNDAAAMVVRLTYNDGSKAAGTFYVTFGKSAAGLGILRFDRSSSIPPAE